MEFNEALSFLLDSKEFKKWKKENPSSHLSHAFIMVDPQVKEEWQIGFFNLKSENVVTFNIGKEITINPESEALNEDKKIEKLDSAKVKITLKEALDLAEKLQKEKYSAYTAFKKIVLLQKLDVGQVWNITYVTNTFKTLNIKIDSEDGKILKHELLDLFRVEK
jgi:SPX domain protein involved in polyphosphate accumulation